MSETYDEDMGVDHDADTLLNILYEDRMAPIPDAWDEVSGKPVYPYNLRRVYWNKNKKEIDTLGLMKHQRDACKRAKVSTLCSRVSGSSYSFCVPLTRVSPPHEQENSEGDMGTLFAMEMGTGKTRTAIVLSAYVHCNPGITLVVVPSNLQDQWRWDIRNLTNCADENILTVASEPLVEDRLDPSRIAWVIITYNRLVARVLEPANTLSKTDRNSTSLFRNISNKPIFETIIFDEIHNSRTMARTVRSREKKSATKPELPVGTEESPAVKEDDIMEKRERKIGRRNEACTKLVGGQRIAWRKIEGGARKLVVVGMSGTAVMNSPSDLQAVVGLLDAEGTYKNNADAIKFDEPITIITEDSLKLLQSTVIYYASKDDESIRKSFPPLKMYEILTTPKNCEIGPFVEILHAVKNVKDGQNRTAIVKLITSMSSNELGTPVMDQRDRIDADCSDDDGDDGEDVDDAEIAARQRKTYTRMRKRQLDKAKGDPHMTSRLHASVNLVKSLATNEPWMAHIQDSTSYTVGESEDLSEITEPGPTEITEPGPKVQEVFLATATDEPRETRRTINIAEDEDRERPVPEGRHKIIVFSAYSAVMDVFIHKLCTSYPDVFENEEDVLRINGDVSFAKRRSILREFRDDDDKNVLVMQYKTGSDGHDLNFVKYVVLIDIWWNPAVMDQAIARAYRMGNTVPGGVEAFCVLTKNSLEEEILTKTHPAKRNMSRVLIEGGKDLSTDGAYNIAYISEVLESLRTKWQESLENLAKKQLVPKDLLDAAKKTIADRVTKTGNLTDDDRIRYLERIVISTEQGKSFIRRTDPSGDAEQKLRKSDRTALVIMSEIVRKQMNSQADYQLFTAVLAAMKPGSFEASAVKIFIDLGWRIDENTCASLALVSDFKVTLYMMTKELVNMTLYGVPAIVGDKKLRQRPDFPLILIRFIDGHRSTEGENNTQDTKEIRRSHLYIAYTLLRSVFPLKNLRFDEHLIVRVLDSKVDDANDAEFVKDLEEIMECIRDEMKFLKEIDLANKAIDLIDKFDMRQISNRVHERVGEDPQDTGIQHGEEQLVEDPQDTEIQHGEEQLVEPTVFESTLTYTDPEYTTEGDNGGTQRQDDENLREVTLEKRKVMMWTRLYRLLEELQ